jgi:hypothetical protein
MNIRCNRALLGCISVTLLLVVATACGATDATRQETLDGTFYWSGRDRRGELEAVFNPVGKSRWQVDFRFTWEDKPHHYSGTVVGDLTGRLEGTIFNEDKEYEFTFSGKFEGKTFRGTHQMIVADREPQPMGTLELKRR